MLTVMDLMSFQLFRNFKLVSGYSGLYNEITGTGILEWESSSDVERSFEPGQFVVTTLSLYRSDAALAENSIRTLIDRKVSAVAIKDIYFHEISDELKAYSDTHHIPVFFFSETFFDDIIYTVKDTLLNYNRDSGREEQIELLLDSAPTPEQKKRKAREINPFFHPNFICCYASLKKGVRWQTIQKPIQLNPEETVYSVIDYRQGILVIYTTKEPVSETKAGLISFLEQSGLRECLNFIGISSPAKGLENMGAAVRESLYAFRSGCRSGRDGRIRFEDTGLDQILLPLAESPWIKRYYGTMVSKLNDYDAKHGSRLVETLLEYVENHGDVKATAEKLFQHSNTIRYRIDKIRRLLNLQDDFSSIAQLAVLVQLYRIYQDSDVTD